MTRKDLPFDAVVWAASLFHKTGPDPRRHTPREILVLRPADFGDLLITTPIFDALRRRFPNTRLIAGIGSWGRPVLENNPFVDEIVTLDVPWFNNFVKQSPAAIARFLFRSPQVKALRLRGGFDVGIDILGSHYGSALMLRLGVRHRVGVRDYRGGWLACQQYSLYSMQNHVVRGVLDQAELLGAIDLPEMRPQLYLTADERAEANRLWNDAAAPGALKLIVGCGAGQPGKIWPAARVARALREVTAALQGERRLNILLLGGAADRVSADQIITNGPPGIRSLCGEASLRVSFALAEQADVALTNASMLFHVAAAFHRPTVTVLGPFFAEDYGDDHDKLWGYPPPYSSVGPTNGTWPSVEAVVAKLVAAAHAGERILA